LEPQKQPQISPIDADFSNSFCEICGQLRIKKGSIGEREDDPKMLCRNLVSLTPRFNAVDAGSEKKPFKRFFSA